MNINFATPHMETLSDLMKLAEKHNCKITFGFASSPEQEIDEDILKKNGFTEELIEEMKEKMTIEDAVSSFDKLWFELYDKNNKTHNSLVYIESGTHFTLPKYNYYQIHGVSEELENLLDEHDEFYRADEYVIHECHNPTIIHGFGNKEKIEDFRVYRSGMALKFFGDLVCDYLKEPRIDRCY